MFFCLYSNIECVLYTEHQKVYYNRLMKDIEILVVDDGTKDNIDNIVQRYQNTLELKNIKIEKGSKYIALNVSAVNVRFEKNDLKLKR